QAEDGIRDFHVTGVQTCALPICGGRHAWDNVVASCRRCNHVKADRHLFELGWRLRHKPAPPTGLAWRIIGTGHRDPRWLPYLQPYGADDAMARIDGSRIDGISA